MTTPVVSPAMPREPHESANRDQPAHPTRPDERGDLCEAGAGSWAERLGNRLAGLHPIVAGAVIITGSFLLLAALIVGIGLVLTELVLPGDVQRWDLDVVRELTTGRPDLNTASLIGSYFSESVTVLAVVGITIAICIWKKWFNLVALLAIAIALEGLLYLVATYFVTRTRPDVPRLEELVVSDSYPSGHVAASVVIWVVLALIVWNVTDNRAVRVAVAFLAAVAPVIVALSRMYRGMHHPTDVVFGYLMGWACVLAALLTVRVAGVVAARRTASGGAS